MEKYVSGKLIREIREKKGLTQKQLGERIGVSEKTTSKWETEKGLPDISLLEPLTMELQISVAELLNGECHVNQNRSANMRKTNFYACPICGNVIHSLGEGSFHCCGIQLPRLEEEDGDANHEIKVERMEDEYYISIQHPMEKEHFISFLAYVTIDSMQMVKLYPQQNAEKRFRICGHGKIYAYCNQHGLFSCNI